jgi:hypothetical protein
MVGGRFCGKFRRGDVKSRRQGPGFEEFDMKAF